MAQKKKKAKPEVVSAKKIGKDFGQINTLLGRIQQFLGGPNKGDKFGRAGKPVGPK